MTHVLAGSFGWDMQLAFRNVSLYQKALEYASEIRYRV